MVSKNPTFTNNIDSEDIDSEELDAAELNLHSGMSSAANMKLQSSSTLNRGKFISQTHVKKHTDDAAHTVVFNQELAYMKESLHEPGYNA